MRNIGLISLFFLLWPFAAAAQDRFWVQIEAQPTLTDATDRARAYARSFDDVEGYYLGTGFYGIMLGPYSRDLAEQQLALLLASGEIPADSYIQNGAGFEQQFWPIGGRVNQTADVEDTSTRAEPITIESTQETPAEARASEALLTRAERKDLQRALAWAGFYTAGIDGAFGRGTRAAMESWQIANARQPTGVLTTAERRALMNAYNAILIEAGMQRVIEVEAGISMDLPTALVSFSQYNPPFAKFTASGALPEAQVLLISQTGDRDRMAGLYEVMQILEIVPFDGPRELRSDGFRIEGINDQDHSTTEVRLEGDQIKGFTLVWPAGDTGRKSRILEAMRASFAPLDGVLRPDIVPASQDQSIDRFSGLDLRTPRLNRSGIFVSGEGHVLTLASAVEGCERITLEKDIEAEIVQLSIDTGLAVLRPLDGLAPLGVAAFDAEPPRLNDPISVAGYPFGGRLLAPTLTFGTVAELRDLGGDTANLRLEVQAGQSTAGGPVLGASGGVLGLLLDPQPGLPGTVQFARKSEGLIESLTNAGVSPLSADATNPLSAVALQRDGGNITSLVSCW